MVRIIIVAVIIVLGIGGYFSLQYSQKKILAEMLDAAQRSDVQALAARVDFDSVKGFLKSDLAAQKKVTGPMAAFAADAGPSADKIDSVVDYYVLPENIGILYYYRDMTFEKVDNAIFVDHTGLVAPFGFQITLGYPKDRAASDIAAAARDRLKVKLVFGLDGLTWKIKEMHVPLFMVPKFVYSTPAIKVYGPRQP